MQLEMQTLRKNSYASETSSVNSSLDSLESFNVSGISDEGLWLDEEEEASACQLISAKLHACLQEAKKTLGGREMVLPPKLAKRISHDLFRMSVDEPCGFRGCALNVHLEEQTICRKLARLPLGAPDRCLPPTFEITLTLRANPVRWPKSLLSSRKLTISDAVTMCKKKLYRSRSNASDFNYIPYL